MINVYDKCMLPEKHSHLDSLLQALEYRNELAVTYTIIIIITYYINITYHIMVNPSLIIAL